jgi:signal peptidase I
LTTTNPARPAGATLAPTSELEVKAKAQSVHHDVRELVEMVVSVLILVSLLRMFGAEAFVIPTGSMATTLLGAHKSVECEQCGVVSYLNASNEAEAKNETDRRRTAIASGICQNCRNRLHHINKPPQGGDRVIVAKFLYSAVADPERWHVVVFKCPDHMKARTNFIKRLIGKPGETIQIRYGDIYVASVKSGDPGDFTIARKPPKTMLAMRRPVFDNDAPPKDMIEKRVPPRWIAEPAAAWTSENGKEFASNGESGLLVYRHIVGGQDRFGSLRPSLITDFEAYNSGETFNSPTGLPPMNYVGDLMLECRIDVGELAGTVSFQLIEGLHTYECILNLAQRRIVLLQNGQRLDESPSLISGAGQHSLCFANFDDRLTVWLDGRTIFGDGVAIRPHTEGEAGPQLADLRPVRIGFDRARIRVSHLAIYRDTYYTQSAQRPDYDVYDRSDEFSAVEIARWHKRLVETMRFDPDRQYDIGPDQYLMLGDNSPSSQDSREWNHDSRVVDRRLILGRALVLYWPPWHWKFIR